MTKPRMIFTRSRLQLVFGLCLAGILYSQFDYGARAQVAVSPVTPVAVAAERVDANPFEKLIRNDPLAALMDARANHVRHVQQYECVMVKQEALPSGMSKEQEIEVKFRYQPFSVYMNWIRNPGLADRVIYVKNRWIDAEADSPEEREMAVAQPGKIARLFVKSVQQPIRGKMARKASRRFLDEFGFQRTLDLLIKYSELAKSRNELKLEFLGESRFDGRPIWVVRRTLPYTGPDGIYPDCTAEIFIDQEHKVPVAVYSYADRDRQPENLLGKYEYRNIRFATGLTDRDFEPSTYGM